MIPNINCANNPTARSEKARLRKNVLILAGIDEAFHRPWIARRFPVVATTGKSKFDIQTANIVVLWLRTSSSCPPNHSAQNCEVMAILIISNRLLNISLSPYFLFRLFVTKWRNKLCSWSKSFVSAIRRIVLITVRILAQVLHKIKEREAHLSSCWFINWQLAVSYVSRICCITFDWLV